MLNSSVYEHLHSFNRSILGVVLTLNEIAADEGMPKDQLTCLGDQFKQLQSRTNALLAGIIVERETERSAQLLQLRLGFEAIYGREAIAVRSSVPA